MSAPQLSVYRTGQGIVNGDQLNTFEQTCNTVSDLRSFVGITGLQVFVRGLTNPGDGGQGPFYWNGSVVATDDGVNTIVPASAASGAWLRLALDVIVPVTALVTTSGTTIAVGASYVPINNTTGLAFSISLPGTPVNGTRVAVKDWAGNAATYHITVGGNGYNIDGASTFVMSTNYQAARFMFVSNSWGTW
jgi:hypothetical protein